MFPGLLCFHKQGCCAFMLSYCQKFWHVESGVLEAWIPMVWSTCHTVKQKGQTTKDMHCSNKAIFHETRCVLWDWMAWLGVTDVACSSAVMHPLHEVPLSRCSTAFHSDSWCSNIHLSEASTKIIFALLWFVTATALVCTKSLTPRILI